VRHLKLGPVNVLNLIHIWADNLVSDQLKPQCSADFSGGFSPNKATKNNSAGRCPFPTCWLVHRGFEPPSQPIGGWILGLEGGGYTLWSAQKLIYIYFVTSKDWEKINFTGVFAAFHKITSTTVYIYKMICLFDPGFTANSAPFVGLEWPLGRALLDSKLAHLFRKIMTRALENLNGNQEKLGVPRTRRPWSNTGDGFYELGFMNTVFFLH
jgi:hypothetical protein